LSVMLPRVQQRLTHSRFGSRGGEMPLFPYLPLILWTAMLQVMLDQAHDPNEQNSQCDPANAPMDPARVVRFQLVLASG